MVRIYSESACSEYPDFAEYDGPSGGGDAPNAVILNALSLFITGSSDGADSQKDIITLKYDISTGIHENPVADNNVMVYPNPVNSTSVIQLGENLAGLKSLSLRVFNVLGEIVYQGEGFDSSVTLDKKDFADGVYAFKIFNDGHAVAGGRFVAE